MPRARRRHPGGLRVAAQGAGGRHRREPRAAARRDRSVRPDHGASAPRAHDRGPHRRHVVERTAGDGPEVARTFLVTTPESLYLLVTAAKSREMLQSVRTVIVDEIHAMARDKRGSHLAMTLERLDHVCRRRRLPDPDRTVGHPDARSRRSPSCWWARPGRSSRGPAESPARSSTRVISAPSTSRSSSPTASSRPSPPTPRWTRSSIASPNWSAEHRTTLMFVNTRRLAERLAHQLGERLSASRGDGPMSRPIGGRSASREPVARTVGTGSSGGCGPAS